MPAIGQGLRGRAEHPGEIGDSAIHPAKQPQLTVAFDLQRHEQKRARKGRWGQIACVSVFRYPLFDLSPQRPPAIRIGATAGQPVGIKPDIARQRIGEIHALWVHRHPARQRCAFHKQGPCARIPGPVGKHPARPVQPVPDHGHRLRMPDKQGAAAIVLRGQQRQFQPPQDRICRDPGGLIQRGLRPGRGLRIAAQPQRHQSPPVQRPQRGQQRRDNQPFVAARIKDDEISRHRLPCCTRSVERALLSWRSGPCP